jgi:hypothetical protein
MVFILAYVEAVCYLGLFHTLTGYISAATILLATEFFRIDGDVITKTLVLVAFVPSTFVWVILKEHLSGWRYFAAMLLVIEAGLLTLYMVVAINFSPLPGVDAPETMLIVVISVLALSLHNVHSQQVMPEKAHIAITALFGNFARVRSISALCCVPASRLPPPVPPLKSSSIRWSHSLLEPFWALSDSHRWVSWRLPVQSPSLSSWRHSV